MKHILFVIVTALLIAVSGTTGYAMVREAQASIDGVSQNMTYEQVKNLHGENYTRTNLARNRYAIEYKNGLYVEFTGNAVSYIQAENNRKLCSYDGLHVGSSLGQVEDALGRADTIQGNYHLYQASGKKDIGFVYNKDNTVVLMYSGLSYEDEENIRRENEKIKNKNNNRRRRDIGAEIERGSRQLRNIYWNLRSIHKHRGGYGWGW